MKSISSFLLIFTIALKGLSQGVFTNDVNSALQKVIQDYPNRFVNIKGPQVTANSHSVQYYSTVKVPGSLNCLLTQHSITRKEIYSWKCVMLESEQFEEAKYKFAELYNQIKNTIIKMQGEKPFILNGKYEVPCAEKKITSVIFQLLPATGDMQRLKVELTLQHYMNDWKVTLTVYDQDRRNDEQPELTDGW
jgi:hypothetical protein